VFATSYEGDVLAGLGKSAAEVSTNPACSKDGYAPQL
jgi:hypothetical protein